MTGFYGKTYWYKNKIIGVCNTLNTNSYMIGHETTGGHKRMKALPLCESIEEAQMTLDEFARAKHLCEARSNL